MLSPFRSTQSITVDVKESKARIRIENPSINKTALTSQHMNKIRPEWEKIIADFEKSINTSDEF